MINTTTTTPTSAKPMYFQVFITNRTTGKVGQISCDTWQEVQDLVEQRNPKFVRIDYYGCEGLIGSGFKYFNFAAGEYVTYKKEVNTLNS